MLFKQVNVVSLWVFERHLLTCEYFRSMDRYALQVIDSENKKGSARRDAAKSRSTPRGLIARLNAHVITNCCQIRGRGTRRETRRTLHQTSQRHLQDEAMTLKNKKARPGLSLPTVLVLLMFFVSVLLLVLYCLRKHLR